MIKYVATARERKSVNRAEVASTAMKCSKTGLGNSKRKTVNPICFFWKLSRLMTNVAAWVLLP